MKWTRKGTDFHSAFCPILYKDSPIAFCYCRADLLNTFVLYTCFQYVSEMNCGHLKT